MSEERKIIEALTPKGPVNWTNYKEGQTVTLKKDLYYGYLYALFDYIDDKEDIRTFVENAKPVMMRNNVMFVIPKGTKLYLETFRPGRDEVFVKVFNVVIPLNHFNDAKLGEVYWDDDEVEEWVK